MSPKVKKIIVLLLKISISCAILGFLFYQAINAKDEHGKTVFTKLFEDQKRWELLAVGAAFALTAVTATMIRWWWLVRTLGVPVKLVETMRIGFIGYLFNLAPLGIVGGDLLKAWLLTKKMKGVPHAGTTILAATFMDRVIGLYALFVLATLTVLVSGVMHSQTIPAEIHPWVYCFSVGVCVAAAVGTVLLFVMLGPDPSRGKMIQKLGRLPKIGEPLEKIILAFRRYQNHLGVFFLINVMGIFIHVLFALSIFFVATGLFTDTVRLSETLWISPTAMSMGAIPLPFGPQEAVFDILFQSHPGIEAGQGMLVALVYRLLCVTIASLGLIFYFSSRDEIQEVVRENEESGMKNRE